ncbi:hypothetical protein N431DRAFT_95188 [Stipitochalara longipes BDJ]|nr:hypothetical protein N431DRAFT_95188 [Stipitochalara longipes BDJ]
MDVLFPELYHEIVSVFEYSNLYLLDDYNSSNLPGNDYFQAFSFERRGSLDVTTLQTLRLTSKAFNEAASRVLFRSYPVIWDALSISEGSKTQLASSLMNSENKLLPMVRRLKVSFQNSLKHFEIGTHDYNDQGPSKEIIEDLPMVLKNLSSLNCLEVYTSSWVMDHRTSSRLGPGLQLDCALLEKVPRAISYGISNMEYLTDLRLLLPCTHDFLELSNSVADSIFHGIRHLFLGVTDATGPGGSMDYLMFLDDDDDEFVLSNLQQSHSNVDHIRELLAVVERCPNLESLGLEGTQMLNCDLLRWMPTTMGLKSLYLFRANISAEKLVTLLSSPAAHNMKLSSIIKVWLERVNLTAGTWSDVFDHLMACPSLAYHNPQDLSYARGGKSSHHIENPNRAFEDSFSLWSNHEPDEEKLLALTHLLIKRSGGREKYPSARNEQVMLPEDEYID